MMQTVGRNSETIRICTEVVKETGQFLMKILTKYSLLQIRDDQTFLFPIFLKSNTLAEKKIDQSKMKKMS